MTEEAIAATERWFRRRGIPHFIEDHGAHRSILTRALPFLTLMLVIEVLLVFNLAWAWWINVLVVGGACGVMAATWAGVNALRRRPLLALPEQVGAVELLVFLLAPSVIAAASVQDWTLAPFIVVVNALILGIAYVSVSFGLLPIVGWAGWLLVRNVRDVAGLFARALPLLLLIVTFLFITEEVWRLAGGLEEPLLGLLIGLFGAVTSAFLVSRLPGEIGELETFQSTERVAGLIRGTPAEEFTVEEGALRLDVPLRRRQWFNAGLVVLFGLALQVAFVSLVLGGFFVVFGMIAMDEGLVRDWVGREPQILLGIDAATGAVLTLEHVKVAAFLTTFSAFYFTVSVVTNPDYRAEFFEDVVRDLRQALAVRTVYLTAIEQEGEAGEAVAASGGEV